MKSRPERRGRGLVAASVLLAAALGAGGIARAADSFECTSVTATGYRQNAADGRWQTQVFTIPEQRYRVLTAGQTWQVVRPEPAGDRVVCQAPPTAAGELSCGADEFRFFRAPLRFESHLPIGGATLPADVSALTVVGNCVPDRG